MRYVIARAKDYDEAMAYRIFISESLRLQGEGKYLTKSYMDIVRPKEVAVKDNRSADEIAESIIKGMGLKVGG